jgi:hypothetical protein
MADETRPLKKKIDGLEVRVEALESLVVDVLAVTDRIEPRMLEEQLHLSDGQAPDRTPDGHAPHPAGSSASRRRAGILDAAGLKRH